MQMNRPSRLLLCPTPSVVQDLSISSWAHPLGQLLWVGKLTLVKVRDWLLSPAHPCPGQSAIGYQHVCSFHHKVLCSC